MAMTTQILNFFRDMIYSLGEVTNWLFAPIDTPAGYIAPIYLFTGGALVLLVVFFIARAII